MSKHFAEGQYDDDLTIGVDEFDNDILFDEVDLLKYKPSESPLAHLKSLILSIDWEITDDILREFNEELLSLREMWRGEKIYLIYIQALETISKYIYQQKSSAHPNAVKLLPAFYYNFEKIVVDDTLTDEEKQDVLLSDVKRFQHLKGQLVGGKQGGGGIGSLKDILQNLKRLVLGIDWEITADDLNALRKEVLILERAFQKSKPKLILLQGIGTLAAYISHKGSNSHADAFTLLHTFFAALEKISSSQLTIQEEKVILFAEVAKFNSFKAMIATTLSPEALSRDTDEQEGVDIATPRSIDVLPAFADVMPEAVSGFQEDQVAASLDSEEDLASRLESFFADDEPVVAVEVAGEDTSEDVTEDFVSAGQDSASVAIEAESRLDDFFQDDFFSADMESFDTEVLLQGVNVETDADDDSDEEDLPVFGGDIAPALSDNDETSSFSDQMLEEGISTDQGVALSSLPAGGLFADEPDEDLDTALSFIDESADFGEALVDIDSGFEDDEDVEDETFSYGGAEPAPALADFSPSTLSGESEVSQFEDQLGIESTLDAFFEDFDDEGAVADQQDAELLEDTAIVIPQVTEQVDLLKEYFDETDSEEESIEESIDQFFGFDEEEVLSSEIESFADSVELTHDYVELSDEPILDFEELTASVPTTVHDVTGDEEVAIAEMGFTGEEPCAEEEVAQSFGVQEVDISALEGEDIVFELVEEDLTESDLEFSVEDSLEGDVVDGSASVFVEVDESVPEDVLVGIPEAASPAVVEVDLFVQPIDIFENLRSSIQSLGIEIETPVVDGVFAEINKLRQKRVGDPLAKSFLQLLSTVTQHIDHYRYECSGDAYNLLLSAFEGLVTVDDVSLARGQEILLLESYKVLQWQQNMIVAYSNLSQRESGIIIDELADSQSISDEIQDGGDLLSEGEDELIYAGLEDELADDGKRSLSSIGVDDIRSELVSLRKTLQEEIAQLRAELLRK